MPFCPFVWGGFPTKIDYRKKGTLILTSLLEDLADPPNPENGVSANSAVGSPWTCLLLSVHSEAPG